MENINKVKDTAEVKIGDTQFTVTIRNKEDEVIYHNESAGGIITTVEKVLDMDGDGITGQQQILGWGNILVQAHGFEMLRQYFHENMDKFIDQAVEVGGLNASPETIAELKRMMKDKTSL